MITKEERAEVKKQINEGRKYSHEYYKDCIGKYEDTVTELEGRLKQAVRFLNNTFKESAVKGCGCHECGELREIRKFINSLSQLEKGDKDNAN